MLCFVLPPSFSLFTFFEVSCTIFPFLYKHCKQFSFIQYSVLIVWLFLTLFFIADSVYYADMLIRLIKNHIKILKLLQFEKF